MFRPKSADGLVILHHTGNSQVLSNRRNFDYRNAGRDFVLRQLFPMSDEREDSVASPSDWYCSIVDHVGHHVPIVLGSVASGASVETMMGGGQRQQDGSFAVFCAHFAIILA